MDKIQMEGVYTELVDPEVAAITTQGAYIELEQEDDFDEATMTVEPAYLEIEKSDKKKKPEPDSSDEEPELLDDGLYDTRTLAAHQHDSDDDAVPQEESAYDPLTLAGLKPALPAAPARTTKPAPVVVEKGYIAPVPARKSGAKSHPANHGLLARAEAEKRLKGRPKGSYLLRESKAFVGYVVSVVTGPATIAHVKAEKKGSMICTTDREFESIGDLIDFYSVQSIHSGVMLASFVPNL